MTIVRSGSTRRRAPAPQLPMVVRGFYYEGWHPAGQSLNAKDAFLAHVAAKAHVLDVDPEPAVRAVFGLLAGRIGEIEDA